MAEPTNRDSDKFMLRLPDGMRDRIKLSADKNGRSMNAEIVARLQATYISRFHTVELDVVEGPMDDDAFEAVAEKIAQIAARRAIREYQKTMDKEDE